MLDLSVILGMERARKCRTSECEAVPADSGDQDPEM